MKLFTHSKFSGASLRMDHLTLYWARDDLSMPGLKSIYLEKVKIQSMLVNGLPEYYA